MNDADILIIGAGACGLMAASELARSGKKVIVLEARDRIGGRIHTLKNAGFSIPVEAGAEFVHGNLPLTRSILTSANISFRNKEGEIYRVEKNTAYRSEEFIEDFDILLSKLKELKTDLPFSEFLDKYFPGEKYHDLRISATRFAEGYDTARIEKLSSVSLRDEWTSEGITSPYILPGGYGGLIDFLAGELVSNGGRIHLSSIVKKVRWEKGIVQVSTVKERSYSSTQLLITVPLGVLLSSPGENAHIEFIPALAEKHDAMKQMGYGSVIKFIFEFRASFWDDRSFSQRSRQLPDMGIIISEATVPVWWSHFPVKKKILSGWLGGPKADELKSLSDDQLVDEAISSLAEIFDEDEAFIKEQVIARKVFNWNTDPFSLGAYGYTTTRSSEAIRVLAQPVEDTIYFAGEALELENIGTVEAALASGKRVAERITAKGERTGTGN